MKKEELIHVIRDLCLEYKISIMINMEININNNVFSSEDPDKNIIKASCSDSVIVGNIFIGKLEAENNTDPEDRR